MTDTFETRKRATKPPPTKTFTAFIVAALMAMTGLPAHSAFAGPIYFCNSVAYSTLEASYAACGKPVPPHLVPKPVHGEGGMRGVTKPAEMPPPVFRPPDRSEWSCYVRANEECATWTDNNGRFAGCHKFARNGSGKCREEYELPSPPGQFATGKARTLADDCQLGIGGFTKAYLPHCVQAETRNDRPDPEPDPAGEPAASEPSKPSSGKMLAPAVAVIGAGLFAWKLTGGDDAPFGLTPMAEWNDAGRSMGFAFRSGALQGMAMSADGEVVGRLEFELVF